MALKDEYHGFSRDHRFAWETFLKDQTNMHNLVVMHNEMRSWRCSCVTNIAAEHDPMCQCPCKTCRSFEACSCDPKGLCVCPPICNCRCDNCHKSQDTCDPAVPRSLHQEAEKRICKMPECVRTVAVRFMCWICWHDSRDLRECVLEECTELAPVYGASGIYCLKHAAELEIPLLTLRKCAMEGCKEDAPIGKRFGSYCETCYSKKQWADRMAITRTVEAASNEVDPDVRLCECGKPGPQGGQFGDRCRECYNKDRRDRRAKGFEEAKAAAAADPNVRRCATQGCDNPAPVKGPTGKICRKCHRARGDLPVDDDADAPNSNLRSCATEGCEVLIRPGGPYGRYCKTCKRARDQGNTPQPSKESIGVMVSRLSDWLVPKKRSLSSPPSDKGLPDVSTFLKQYNYGTQNVALLSTRRDAVPNAEPGQSTKSERRPIVPKAEPEHEVMTIESSEDEKSRPKSSSKRSWRQSVLPYGPVIGDMGESNAKSAKSEYAPEIKRQTQKSHHSETQVIDLTMSDDDVKPPRNLSASDDNVKFAIDSPKSDDDVKLAMVPPQSDDDVTPPERPLRKRKLDQLFPYRVDQYRYQAVKHLLEG